MMLKYINGLTFRQRKTVKICEIAIDLLTFCKKSGIIIMLAGTLRKRVPAQKYVNNIKLETMMQ